MAIKRLEIHQLGAFEHADFDLVPGINVFLGANSTGKTHALKWLYGSVKALEQPVEAGESSPDRLKQKIAGVFRPDERQVGRLVNRDSKARRGQVFVGADEGEIGYFLSTYGTIRQLSRRWDSQAPAIFMPSREALALVTVHGVD